MSSRQNKQFNLYRIFRHVRKIIKSCNPILIEIKLHLGTRIMKFYVYNILVFESKVTNFINEKNK